MSQQDDRQYPKINSLSSQQQKETLFIIKSLTYNIEFLFLPYNMKITENLTPEWNEQPVIGRMDPISNFKRMGRTMTVTFQARANLENVGSGFLNLNELLHTIDHLKKTLYPRYDTNRVMVSPPLFRVRYGNLILAGKNTQTKGVLCYITSFSANPVMDQNKIYVDPNNKAPFYPKVFDINLTFTVLNEALPESQDNNILDETYFYNYKTDYHKENGVSDVGSVTSGNTRVEDSGQQETTAATRSIIGK